MLWLSLSDMTKFKGNNIDHLTKTTYSTTDDWNQSEFLQQTSAHLLSQSPMQIKPLHPLQFFTHSFYESNTEIE